jgi:hypothetical protein
MESPKATTWDAEHPTHCSRVPCSSNTEGVLTTSWILSSTFRSPERTSACGKSYAETTVSSRKTPKKACGDSVCI